MGTTCMETCSRTCMYISTRPQIHPDSVAMRRDGASLSQRVTYLRTKPRAISRHERTLALDLKWASGIFCASKRLLFWTSNRTIFDTARAFGCRSLHICFFNGIGLLDIPRLWRRADLRILLQLESCCLSHYLIFSTKIFSRPCPWCYLGQ